MKKVAQLPDHQNVYLVQLVNHFVAKNQPLQLNRAYPAFLNVEDENQETHPWPSKWLLPEFELVQQVAITL